MENEVTQIITDEESEENLEGAEIQVMKSGTHLIPFQFIKLARNMESDADESEGVTSQGVIGVPSTKSSYHKVKGKYYYKQTYRPAWEHMPDFKGWLRGVKGQPTRAYCTYCQKTLHAHRLSLLKHTCTIRHQKAAQLHGNPTTQHSNNYDVNLESDEIKTLIVSEEALLKEEDSSELMQSHIVYTSQEEMEEEDNEMENDPEKDDSDGGDESTTTMQENSQTKKENIGNLPPISTTVIDTTRGAPVIGLSVSLYKLVDGRWTYINEGLTDSKGRCSSFFKKGNFCSGRYKLHYDVDRYFEAKKHDSLFPFIETVFDCTLLTRYNFPLLLSPNSYTTYRSTYEE